MTDPGQRIEVHRQPAPVSSEELLNEFSGRVGIRSNQILPRRFRIGTARNLHVTCADADLTAVEIQIRSQRQKFFQTD